VTERRPYCLRGHDAALAGRDSSGRCLICKREAMAEVRAAREAELQAARTAELVRVRADGDRRREREHERALAAGGAAAQEARWQRLWDRTLDETNGRYALCQQPQHGDGPPGGCDNRTADVYCAKHSRELERNRVAVVAAPVDPAPRVSRRRDTSSVRAMPPGARRCLADGCLEPAVPNGSRCEEHNTGGWAAYKTKHPQRAAFYASSTWRNMRDAQLRDFPFCVVCGEKASHADHVLAIALGGSQDGPLQSMCAEHHRQKTLADSHGGAKRRAARRKEK
jgi:hypothetical protein